MLPKYWDLKWTCIYCQKARNGRYYLLKVCCPVASNIYTTQTWAKDRPWDGQGITMLVPKVKDMSPSSWDDEMATQVKERENVNVFICPRKKDQVKGLHGIYMACFSSWQQNYHTAKILLQQTLKSLRNTSNKLLLSQRFQSILNGHYVIQQYTYPGRCGRYHCPCHGQPDRKTRWLPQEK